MKINLIDTSTSSNLALVGKDMKTNTNENVFLIDRNLA